MKQAVFVILSMVFLAFRSLTDPFWGAFLYYAFAVLRPQAIWEWALSPVVPAARWSLYAAIIALLAVVIGFGSLRPRVAQRQFATLILLFSACLFGSYLFAHDQPIAGRMAWEYAKIFIMVMVGTLVVTERRHLRYLGWMIFACLTYLVYEVNYLYLFQGRLDIFHFGYGGLDNNGAALMLAMVIPFCYTFFEAERRVWRWGFLACALPAAHAVMLTYSRGAMVSALTAGAGLLLTSGKNRGRALAVGLVFMVAVLSLAGPEVRARFLTMNQNEQNASARSRRDSWRAGLLIALDYPVFGYGIRNSEGLTHQYGADLEGRTIHNVFIQVAADSGFPAAGILIALVVYPLVWMRRGARMAAAQSSHGPSEMGPGGGLPHRPMAAGPAGGNQQDYESRWHEAVCRGSFWSLTTFAVGALFLSLEHLELTYLLMLMGAVAPGLAAQGAKAPDVSAKDKAVTVRGQQGQPGPPGQPGVSGLPGRQVDSGTSLPAQ